jgi:hypothetical protein
MGRKHKNTVFFCYTGRANSPVKLERPEGVKEMTQERFDMIVANQGKWREQYLQNVKEVGKTNFHKISKYEAIFLSQG